MYALVLSACGELYIDSECRFCAGYFFTLCKYKWVYICKHKLVYGGISILHRKYAVYALSLPPYTHYVERT